MQARTLHHRLEDALGFDVRLFYGLMVPAGIVVLLVVGLALSPTWWLLAPAVLVLLAMVGIVMVGIFQMLGE